MERAKPYTEALVPRYSSSSAAVFFSAMFAKQASSAAASGISLRAASGAEDRFRMVSPLSIS